MARPTKFRRVEFFPEDDLFVPWGKPKCEIEEIALKVEELEAMRLKDIEELNQEECAKCETIYEINFDQDRLACPSCGSDKVMCSKKAGFCKSWCRGNNTDNNS